MTIHRISLRAFERTRFFFRYTATSKSGNKRYGGNTPPEVGPFKIQRRWTGCQTAQPWINWARANVMPGRTLRHYGLWLYRQGARAGGNCAEMSCVALYNFSVAQAEGAFPPFPVRYIELQTVGDHSFLVAGYLPPVVVDVPYNELSTVNVAMMCNAIPDMAESYAVDVWAGIFCPTWEYPFQLREKMRKWSRRGKEVRVGHAWVDPVPEDPAAARYANSLLDSHFYIGDPAAPL